MRKKSILLLEVFIWILLLGGLVCLGANFANNYFSARKNYQVVFKDVDSLLIGAPVRIMGIQVGHVVEVKPIRDEVFVTFVITEPKVVIPKGSKVNIQFTGLAGSKSLEIEPPDYPKKSGDLISVVEPIRINSLMEIQAKVSESVLDGSKNMLDFFGHGGMEAIKSNIKYSKDITKESEKNFNDASTVLDSTAKLESDGSGSVKKFLSEQSKGVDSFKVALSYSSVKESKNVVKSFKNSVKGVYEPLENGKVQSNARNISKNLKVLDSGTANFKQKLDKSPDAISKMHSKINQALTSLNQILNFSDKNINSDNLYKLHRTCKGLKNASECMKNEL